MGLGTPTGDGAPLIANKDEFGLRVGENAAVDFRLWTGRSVRESFTLQMFLLEPTRLIISRYSLRGSSGRDQILAFYITGPLD